MHVHKVYEKAVTYKMKVSLEKQHLEKYDEGLVLSIRLVELPYDLTLHGEYH